MKNALFAALIVGLLTCAGYFSYHFAPKSPSTLGDQTHTQAKPQKLKLSPLATGEIQELYKLGNELSQEIESGISRSEFDRCAVKMRSKVASILKLFPPDKISYVEPQFRKLDLALRVTGDAWDVYQEGIRREDDNGGSVTVSTDDHGLLFLQVANLVHNNPYGAQMAICEGNTISLTGRPLADGTLDDVNAGKKVWQLLYTDSSNKKHSDVPMLLSLCKGYWKAVEDEILPLLRET